MIGGASRSGTTLVRVMVDSHPDIACGPESSLFRGVFHETILHRQFDFARRDLRRLERQCASFPEFVERVLGAYARRQGKAHFAEKTPANVRNIGWILDRFTNAHFVHTVRDGRAVVNSLRTHPRYRFIDGKPVPTGIVRDIDDCITEWLDMVRPGLEYTGHPRVAELRYEDLVERPEEVLTPILARAGWAWADEMARHTEAQSESRSAARLGQSQEAAAPITKEAVDRWREELSADAVARVEDRGGDVLVRLGYK